MVLSFITKTYPNMDVAGKWVGHLRLAVHRHDDLRGRALWGPGRIGRVAGDLLAQTCYHRLQFSCDQLLHAGRIDEQAPVLAHLGAFLPCAAGIEPDQDAGSLDLEARAGGSWQTDIGGQWSYVD